MLSYPFDTKLRNDPQPFSGGVKGWKRSSYELASGVALVSRTSE